MMAYTLSKKQETGTRSEMQEEGHGKWKVVNKVQKVESRVSTEIRLRQVRKESN